MRAGWIVAIVIAFFLWVEATHPAPRPVPDPDPPVTLCQGMTQDQCDAYIWSQRP